MRKPATCHPERSALSYGLCSTCRSRRDIRQARAQVMALLGATCRRCGFDDVRALQVDHVDGGGTQEKRRLNYLGVLRRVLEHPDEYQVLCANCNWIKRHEQGERQLIQEVMT